MFNYKRTNNSIETISAIICNMTDKDFNKLNDLSCEILYSLKSNKNILAKAQYICKKYGITYGDFVAWTAE